MWVNWAGCGRRAHEFHSLVSRSFVCLFVYVFAAMSTAPLPGASKNLIGSPASHENHENKQMSNEQKLINAKR